MIKIIPFNKKYKEDVVRLILDIYEKELGFIGYDRPDIFNINETYQKNEKSNFWLALNNNELIGTIGILSKTENLAYLKRMVVKKEFRKQGLGQKLLQTALKFVKEHGLKKIYAGTVPENPNTAKFYQQNGFIKSNNIPKDITAAKNSICFEMDL